MTEVSAKHGRTHDAEGAREAILDAAEKVFAEHGFDGARIDAIAAEATYNKSLIFQYFDDKLGLYSAVIRRVDEQTRELQNVVMDEFAAEGILSNIDKLKGVLKSYLGAYFDYMVAHPQLMRIFMWEMAEGWQTYAKVLTPADYQDLDMFKPLLEQIQAAGLLRSGFNPILQLLLIEFIYPCYLSLLPMYRAFTADDDPTTPEALAQSREFIIGFVLHGIFAESAGK